MARVLAPARPHLLITARDEVRLEALATECRAAGAEVDVFVHDLGVADGSRGLAERVWEAGHDVDVLINNAGFARMGALVEYPAEDYEKLVTVNATNVVSLTRRFLPAMIERGEGGVLNMASASAYVPLPNMAVYAATKAFVKSFSEAVHAEVKKHGVHVTCVTPGAVESDTFFERAGMARPVGGFPAMRADSVARGSLRALQRNRRLYPVGVFDKFLSVAPGLVPTSLTLFLARFFVDRAR